MQVLRSLVQVFKLLAEAPAAPVSAGMDLLNAYKDCSGQQVPQDCSLCLVETCNSYHDSIIA